MISLKKTSQAQADKAERQNISDEPPFDPYYLSASPSDFVFLLYMKSNIKNEESFPYF